MEVDLYNTLSHRVERFAPIETGTVRMYTCGPTVYDFAHIGNFRAFLFGDLVRRFLEAIGYRVEHVMNITDVGHMTEDELADGGGRDKMEVAAERLKEAKKQGKPSVEDPDDPFQVADFYTQVFLEDARLLRLKVAEEGSSHMPRATQYIGPMMQATQRLLEQGHAYVTTEGAVYYDVRSFPDYGRLSGNTLERLQAGAGGRVSDAEQAGKRHPADFLLWKADPKHLMKWPSPWGTGYPGWHIECSTMALSTMGVETLDIHTGGEDNIFPHHECEIAQATGATGKPLANYWLHTRFLLAEGEKMAKSRGNFYTVRELLRQGVDPAVLRYELLRAHYRQNANFTRKGLVDADKAIERLRQFAAAHPDARPESSMLGDTPVERDFAVALADDMNVSGAIGALFKWISATPEPTAEDVRALRRMDQVLGIVEGGPSVKDLTTEGVSEEETAELSDAEVEEKVRRIDAARAAKDYATSDAIRDELREAGIEVRSTREGTTWRRRPKVEG